MAGLDGADLAACLRWLVVVEVAALVCLPLARRLGPWAPDGGMTAARLLGVTLLPFLAWYPAALGLMPFGLSGVLALAGLAALAGVLVRSRPSRAALVAWAVSTAGMLALFVLGLAARLAMPDLDGLEKFMDHGFVGAGMRAGTIPPEDMWFAGAGINYYHFGHLSFAILGKLADVSSDEAYQLGMATLFALTGLASFHVVRTLSIGRSGQGRTVSAVVSAFAAAAVLYGGNLHSFLYDALRGWMPGTADAFHYPDSTRFIGFDPPTDDKGFTEFLAYAFKAGDLHAHLLATPVFALALILTLAILRGGWLSGRLRWPQSLACGWTLGLAYITNAWDVAILGLVVLLTALVLMLRPLPRMRPPRRRGASALARADRFGAHAVLALAAAAATAAPFVSGFTVFAEGVQPVPNRTPAWQLAVLYGHGLPALAVACGALLLTPRVTWPLAATAILLSAAALLVLLPEMLFVKDFYGSDFARANTMFKLSFRAQWLLLLGGFALASMLLSGPVSRALIGVTVAVPLLLPLSYAAHTFVAPHRLGALNGLAFLGPEESLARRLAATGLAPGEAMAEAPGVSYTHDNRLSAATGLPSVLGWINHQRLWRGDDRLVEGRVADLDALFTAAAPEEACRIVTRYNLRILVLDASARERYATLSEDVLRDLSVPMAQAGDTELRWIPDGACPPA